jgi:hypothetical protein
MLPTFEEIQVCAYFIWQYRVSKGISGDSDGDWYGAEQLLTESPAT